MTTTPTSDRQPGRARVRRHGPVLAAVSALAAMVPVGFFYAASGLVVPGPYLYLFWLIYVALLGAALWLSVRRSYLVLSVPVVAAVTWVSAVSLGEAVLGWTA